MALKRHSQFSRLGHCSVDGTPPKICQRKREGFLRTFPENKIEIKIKRFNFESQEGLPDPRMRY